MHLTLHHLIYLLLLLLIPLVTSLPDTQKPPKKPKKPKQKHFSLRRDCKDHKIKWDNKKLPVLHANCDIKGKRVDSTIMLNTCLGFDDETGVFIKGKLGFADNRCEGCTYNLKWKGHDFECKCSSKKKKKATVKFELEKLVVIQDDELRCGEEEEEEEEQSA